MPNSGHLRSITAALLSVTAIGCAVPVATASANARHDQRARCEVHAVVVLGEVSSPAASGATTFTANVRSVRVFAIHPGADSALCASSTASGTTSTSGTSACPVPSSTSATTSTPAKGVAINTASTTKVTLNGAASTVGALPHGDHFVALFLVPVCAGDGSNSGIPALFLAAWPPHSSPTADLNLSAIDGAIHRDHHGIWDKDRWGKDHHHGSDHRF